MERWVGPNTSKASAWVQRALMNSRGDDLIDLAKTNLLPR